MHFNNIKTLPGFSWTRELKIIGCILLFVAGHKGYSQDLIIKGGWLFTSTDDKIVSNPGIWIKSGKIMQLGNVDSQINTSVIQLSNTDFVLPGLIDLHAHYRVSYDGVAKDDTVAMPKIFLANGVTSTFPAGEVEPEKMKDLRKKISLGETDGPRILSSGPYYGAAAPDWNEHFTTQDIFDRVDQAVANGAKGFKAKNITPKHLQALIQRAHYHGLTVTGHLNSGVNNSVNPNDAILMGIDRIEHFLGGDLYADSTHAYNSLQGMNPNDPKINDIINLYIRHGVYFSATLGTYGAIGYSKDPAFDSWIDETQFLTPFTKDLVSTFKVSDFSQLCAKIYPVKMSIIKRYYDAGGLISLGTDRPLLLKNYLGSQLGGFFAHREIELMVAAGIPPADALKIGTINSARAIGLSDRLGSIEVSKWADLMVIKGNPLDDIRNTRTVHIVIKGGEVFFTKNLLEQVKGKLGPTSKEEWIR